MGSRNGEPQSLRNDQMVPNHLEADLDGQRTEVRTAVAREFSLMEQAHDRIRALELSARLGESQAAIEL